MKLYGAQAGMYFFINDHLGTPQKIVNNPAQVVWSAAYLPFGKAQVKPNTVENNLRFPGQYFDAESGLHYNWHRYYDPETGRYITADPIGLEGGINLYAYVMGNPVNGTDPSCRLGHLAIGAIAGAVGGAITGYMGSGGDMKATLLSAAAGAGAGMLTAAGAGPIVSGILKAMGTTWGAVGNIAIVNAVTSGLASGIGQAVGNLAQCNSPMHNFSWWGVAGASLGGAYTALNAVTPIADTALQVVTDGLAIGLGEFLGNLRTERDNMTIYHDPMHYQPPGL